MVVFRLTQDEYKRLQRASTRTGARNISDYTRAQLLDESASKGASGRLEGRLVRFDKRLSELQSEVRQVARLLKQMKDS
jgi:hypothetical protein